MLLRFCPKCGGKLEEEVEFCSFCGADLRERIAKEKEVESTTRPVPPEQSVISPPSEKAEISEKISEKQFANILPRIGALVIDYLAILGISIIAIIFFHRLGPIFFLIIVPLIMFFYFWILEIITDGRTLGKMAFRLRTVDAKTFEPAKPGSYLVNNLLKSTPITFIIDLIIGFFVNIGSSKKRLRIMQNLSNTCVIRT